LAGEQDLRNMGGLRSKIPWTYRTMMCAAIAIAGVPPCAGFFSKDAILLAAYDYAPWIYWLGTLTAGLTAFYVFRAMFLTFFGEYRGDRHPHESPPVMLIPLAALAALSVVGGFAFRVPEFLGGPAAGENRLLMAISVFAGLFGVFLAWWMYVARPGLADAFVGRFKALYTLVYNKYFVDEIYGAAVVQPVVNGSRRILWRDVDVAVVDGAANGVGARAQRIGDALRRLQSGNIRSYAAWVAFGAVLAIVAIGIAGGAR
jgi:NADH-quinone oxidoreductase subunit L